MAVVKLQKLPEEFLRPRKEKNLLTYKDFQILLALENDEIVGSVRVGSAIDGNSGLITDFNGDPLLIDEAEKILKERGIKNVDAYYLDGPGKLEHFYKKGFEPQRRTVEIEWDLKNQNSKVKSQKYKLKFKDGKDRDLEEIEELFKNSFQPYWVAPYDFKGKSFFVVYEGDKAIGMIDEDLEVGVVIRKGYGGEGLGSTLLNHALLNLKKKGKKKASILVTSGLDDYDPQVYLYTMNGGKIVREYINLQKTL